MEETKDGRDGKEGGKDGQSEKKYVGAHDDSNNQAVRSGPETLIQKTPRRFQARRPIG